MKTILKIHFIVFFLFFCAQIIPAQSDSTLIKKHLTAITKTEGFRNHKNLPLLNKVAAYIYTCFEQYADTVYYQEYKVKDKTYKNVVCRFGKNISKPLIVAGAHYDVCGEQEGADDNASGVTALLELARMLHKKTLTHPIELVAYSLEEPPYFRTPYMGSNIHAQSLKKSGTQVYGMLAIEMIGYFSDKSGSQGYPVKAMKVVYGSKGDYILLVKKSGYGEFVREFSKQFNDVEEEVTTHNVKAPSKLQGIDFSDHLNYWNAGYDALMVTNTAFYRNKNYHKTTDTMETLDINRMSTVIDSIYHALTNIANEEEGKRQTKVIRKSRLEKK